MNMETAREKAGSAWAQETISNKTMDVELAEAFANIIVAETRAAAVNAVGRLKATSECRICVHTQGGCPSSSGFVICDTCGPTADEIVDYLYHEDAEEDGK